MSIRGLGMDFDICPGITPVADLAAGANTGLRLHMRNYGGVAIVAFMGAVSAGTDTFTIDVQEHNAASSGTSQDLDVVTEVYVKSEATLDNDESWERVTQAAASEVPLAGATYAARQLIAVVQVEAAALTDGFEWISALIPDAGAGGTRAGSLLYIPYGLKVQRAPQALASALGA